jgi:hypothetical protein
MKMPTTYGIEKYLLRKAFDDKNIIPKSVLWRVKEGMSDGVSSQSRGWFQIIQEEANKRYPTYTEEDQQVCSESQMKFLYNDTISCIKRPNTRGDKGINLKNDFDRLPRTREAKWFYDMYCDIYGEHNVGVSFQYYWLPQWSGNTYEPSARTLTHYNKIIN